MALIKNLMTSEQYRKMKHTHKETLVSSESWLIVGLPIPKHDYRFYSERKWAFDYAWPEVLLAVEIEGGFYSKDRPVICHVCKTPVMAKNKNGRAYTVQLPGAHAGARYLADMDKYNTAAVLGWTVLRYVPKDINYMQIAEVYKCKMLNK